MIWGTKMLLKINQKITEILDAFLKQKVGRIREMRIPGGMCGVPGILNLPRIRLHII